jgi:death on curing protein
VTKYLTADQVIIFHDILLKKFGGLPGIRDTNLLHSALESPKASFEGKEMYPSIYEKAAAYLYHLAKNHPFNDGNKRTSYVTALAFLKSNETPIKFKISDLESVVVATANGKLDKEHLTRFFKNGKLPKLVE